MMFHLTVEEAIMPMGTIRQDGLCPNCFLPSMHVLSFATYERNRPTGMVQTVPWCADCGFVDG